MGAEITKKVSLNAEDALRELEKLRDKYDTLQKKMQELSDRSKKDTKDSVDGLGKQVSEVQNLVTGYLSLSAAIGVTRQAYDQWKSDQVGAGRTLGGYNEQLLQTMARLGRVNETQTVDQQLRAMAAGAPTALSALRAAGEGNPSLPTAGLLSIAGAASRATPLVGEQGVGALANLAARLGVALPGVEGEGAVDLARVLQSEAVGDVSALGSRQTMSGIRTIMASGRASPSDALAFALMAQNADVGPKSLESMAQQIQASGLSVSDVLGNKSLTSAVLGDDAHKLDRFSRQDFERLRGRIGSYGGALSSELEAAGGSAAGRDVLEDARLGRSLVNSQLGAAGQRGDAYSDASDALNAMLNMQDAGMLRRMWARFGFETDYAVNSLIGSEDAAGAALHSRVQMHDLGPQMVRLLEEISATNRATADALRDGMLKQREDARSQLVETP